MRPGGGRIRDGGEVGGDSVGFLIGEHGTVYLQRLIVAARGRVRVSYSSRNGERSSFGSIRSWYIIGCSSENYSQ